MKNVDETSSILAESERDTSLIQFVLFGICWKLSYIEQYVNTNSESASNQGR